MNKKEKIKIFEDYLERYDKRSPQIQMKMKHTYRVADIAFEIAKSIPEFTFKEYDLCWMIGLLHDIGRFEQLRLYGTFSDVKSVDHAEFGADILFQNNLIDEFIQENISDYSLSNEKEIIEISIRQHNKYKLPEEIKGKNRIFCDVIRDADKLDIFRVICETPFELRMSNDSDSIHMPARVEIMNFIKEHKSIKKLDNMTEFETHLMGCAMAFDLVFEKSREIAKNQGWLSKLLLIESKSEAQKKQMDYLREELSFIC